jgi:hypothetical protein
LFKIKLVPSPNPQLPGKQPEIRMSHQSFRINLATVSCHQASLWLFCHLSSRC